MVRMNVHSLFALVTLAAAVLHPVQEVEPIVLAIDPDTKQPLGPLEEPRGPLLDPRDLPAELHPYFEVVRGLEGFEASLTALFARSLGFALERGNLDRAYRPHASAVRDDWNAAVASLLERLDPDQPEWVAAAIYHDTGRRILTDEDEVHVVGTQRLHLEPIEPAAFASAVEFERLIALFGPEMSKEQAKELRALIEEHGIEVSVVENPWYSHATAKLMFLALGAWSDDLVYPNPFEISAEEFLDRCSKALHAELVQPLVPACPEEIAADGLYFYEGFAVARIALDDDWDAPEQLLAHNSATHRPLLFIGVAPMKRYSGKAKLKRLEISMLAGGEERELYSGKWPLK